MRCHLGVGPLFIFILHSFRRDRKLSDVVQVHLNLAGAPSLGWADVTIDDDFLHKGEDHVVRYFCAVPIFAGEGKELVGLSGGSLHFVQPSLIICELGFQHGFLLLVLRRQLVKAFLRDMPQGIILVQLLQQMLQTGDVLFLLADVLCQLLPIIRLVGCCFLRESATETIRVSNGISVNGAEGVSHNFPDDSNANRIVSAEPFFISSRLLMCSAYEVVAFFMSSHAMEFHWYTTFTTNH